MPGFWRSLYGIFGYEYNSLNDIPNEKDVKLKQTLMRQISLSKVKLKKVERIEQKTPDLQVIAPVESSIPAWFKITKN